MNTPQDFTFDDFLRSYFDEAIKIHNIQTAKQILNNTKDTFSDYEQYKKKLDAIKV